MKTGILGTGIVSRVVAAKLALQGHEVIIGTRNVAATLAKQEKDPYGNPPFAEWHKANPEIALGTFSEAAAQGEIIFNCTSGMNSIAALKQAGEENLTGKVLIDIANPLDFSKGMMPVLNPVNDDSLAESIQRTFPGVKVVKTLNTMNAYLMVDPSLVAGDHSVFVSGNDSEAKSGTTEILKSFGWAERNIIDLGDITTARGTEQLLPIWIRLWSKLQNPMFNFHIVQAR